MFQVRIHGRGGQGVVTAAEMLSIAAFEEGRHAQAFPSFGSERTGAPVVAFCRIADKEIRLRGTDHGTRRDHHPGSHAAASGRCFSGLKQGGYILINTKKTFEQLGLGEFVRDWPAERLCTVSATELGIKHVGRPVPNVPLLGGFAAVSGIIQLESVTKAIRDKFSGKIADGNIAAAAEAFAVVRSEMELALHGGAHHA